MFQTGMQEKTMYKQYNFGLIYIYVICSYFVYLTVDLHVCMYTQFQFGEDRRGLPWN